MSLLFKELNGKLPGPSILVFIGKIGNPHDNLQLKFLS